MLNGEKFINSATLPVAAPRAPRAAKRRGFLHWPRPFADGLEMADTKFKPGHPGGPGRPKGSRNRLNEDFLADLHEAWGQRGKQALAEASPDVLVKVVAGLLPKQVEVTRPLESMTDEELAAAAEYLKAIVAQSAPPTVLQ